jgi:cytidine deaminase
VPKLEKSLEDTMVDRALRARDRAYAPYSRFLVGACALVERGDGVITLVDGCNVENASYGLCICAERTAISAAVALGYRTLIAIAVATASSPPSPPCGMCRQVIAEFAPPGDDVIIVCANTDDERIRTTSARMLPGGFNADLLAKGRTPPGSSKGSKASKGSNASKGAKRKRGKGA